MDESLQQHGDMPNSPEDQLLQPGQPEEHALDGTMPEAVDQAPSESPEVHIPIDQSVTTEAPVESTQPESSVEDETPRIDEGLSRADEPTTRGENKEVAHGMANIYEQYVNIADNMLKSADPKTVAAAQTMREKGPKLAEEARAKFEKEEKAYEAAQNAVIGWVASVVKPGDKTGAEYNLFAEDYQGKVEGIISEFKDLNPIQRQELRQTVYDMAGLEAPTSQTFVDNSKTSPMGTVFRRITSEGSGFRVIEDRKYGGDVHANNELEWRIAVAQAQ